jgi:hypothetical protein
MRACAAPDKARAAFQRTLAPASERTERPSRCLPAAPRARRPDHGVH